MSLGDLLGDARQALHQAAAGIDAGRVPANTVDLLSAVTARSAAYAGLARCVAAMAGGSLTIDTGRRDHGSAVALAEGLLRERGQHTNKLYAALRAAADTGGYPPTLNPMSPESRQLVRAADLVGAAADLLAGHVPLDGPPHSREGVAMRAGGATRAGLGMVAGLTHELVRVDRRMPGWLAASDGAGSRFIDRYAPALRAPRWATSSGLSDLADVLIGRAATAPDIGVLEPVPPETVHILTGAGDPVARLGAVGEWSGRYPEMVDARHLRAATQLGLAVTLLADGPNQVDWRTAVQAATLLNSPPTTGLAQYVAADLAELTAGARDRLHDPDLRTSSAAAMAGLLPGLADALRQGLSAGVARRAILVATAGLAARPVKMVYRYQTTARPATLYDPPVVELGRALTACAGPDPDAASGRPRSAAVAFPRPPQPGNAPTTPPPPQPAHTALPRTRHR